jgi:O-antigen/teichoic acid export membrane protein
MIYKLLGVLNSRQGMRLASLLDQIVFSISNFVLTLVFIRKYTKSEFAAYGIALFATLALAGIYRVSVAIPVALWSSREFNLRRRALSALHLSVVTVILTLLVVSMLYLWQSRSGEMTMLIGMALIATGTTYISLDIDRVMLFRTRPASQALLVLGTYSCVIIIAATAFFWFHPSFAAAMIVLAAIALCKTVGVGLLSGRPDWSHARLLMQRLIRTTVGWNTVGSLAGSSYMIVPQWALGILATSAQVAGFTAVRTPIQPVMVIIRSLDIVDKVRSGQLNTKDPDSLRRHYRRVYFLYLAVCSVFAVAIFLFTEIIIKVVLTPQYEAFDWTLRLSAILLALTATAAPLETVVYQRKSYRPYAISQIIGGIVGAVSAWPLAGHFGANGAVVASIIGWMAPYCFLLKRFVDATR